MFHVVLGYVLHCNLFRPCLMNPNLTPAVGCLNYCIWGSAQTDSGCGGKNWFLQVFTDVLSWTGWISDEIRQNRKKLNQEQNLFNVRVVFIYCAFNIKKVSQLH